MRLLFSGNSEFTVVSTNLMLRRASQISINIHNVFVLNACDNKADYARKVRIYLLSQHSDIT
jgi:hypothetical protein